MTTKKNAYVGSTFESWLDEQGIREEVTSAATREVIAAQLAAEIRKGRVAKAPGQDDGIKQKLDRPRT